MEATLGNNYLFVTYFAMPTLHINIIFLNQIYRTYTKYYHFYFKCTETRVVGYGSEVNIH